MEKQIEKQSLLSQLKNSKTGLLSQLIKEVKEDKTPNIAYEELTEEEKIEEEKFLKKFKKLFL